MAENYVRMAAHIEDPSTAQRFNDLAKDEIRHCEFLQSVLEKERKEMEKGDTKRLYEDTYNSYEEMIDDWKDRVVYKINNFQTRR